MRTLSIGRAIIHAVAYSADGRFLVTLNSRRRLRFWDLESFKQRSMCLLGETGVARASWDWAFTPGGGAVSCRDGIWDLGRVWTLVRKTSDPMLECRPIRLDLPAGVRVTNLAASEDLIVGATHHFDGGRHVFRVRTWGRDGSARADIDPPSNIWGWGRLALSPDSATLAVPAVRELHLFDLNRRQVVARLGHTDFVHGVAFSPNGRSLACRAGRCVWLWDVTTLQPRQRFKAFRKYADTVAFDPTGRLLAAGSREGELRVWDVGNLRPVARFDWDIGAINGLAFSPDGLTAAAAGQRGKIVVWDLE